MIGSPPTASFHGSYDESTRTLSVVGDVDDRRVFTAMLSGQVESNQPSYVDLNAVTFLPSSALGVLVVAHRAAARAGGSLAVTSDGGTIAHRVLTVAGFPMAGRPS